MGVRGLITRDSSAAIGDEHYRKNDGDIRDDLATRRRYTKDNHEPI